MTNDQGEVASSNRRVLHASCTRHGGARRFTNIVMSKVDGTITIDPHATACVIELDEDAAREVHATLGTWLG